MLGRFWVKIDWEQTSPRYRYLTCRGHLNLVPRARVPLVLVLCSHAHTQFKNGGKQQMMAAEFETRPVYSPDLTRPARQAKVKKHVIH